MRVQISSLTLTSLVWSKGQTASFELVSLPLLERHHCLVLFSVVSAACGIAIEVDLLLPVVSKGRPRESTLTQGHQSQAYTLK